MQPTDVFVPGRFPIKPTNVYADRGEPQNLISGSWSRGFVPVVFGSYGTGKSSLVRYCSLEDEEAGRLVYIESVYQKSLASIFERILEVVGYEVQIENTKTSERSSSIDTGFEVGGGLLGYLKAKLTGKLTKGRKNGDAVRMEVLVRSPTDSKLLDLCEENGLLLLIDELHQASDSLRRELSAFLKSYANRNCSAFRIGLVGTEDDAGSLVVRDPGIDRLLQEVAVPPISKEEAEDIVVPGMKRLGLKIDSKVVDRTVRAGVGSPFIVQFLCLEMAEEIVKAGSKRVDDGTLDSALRSYASTKAQRSIQAYHRAIETTGPKRYRKQILHAMASIDNEYVTMEEIVSKVSEQLEDKVPSTALSGPLRKLKLPECGEVLADVEGFAPDKRAYNYSTFSDPAMKAVIRLVMELGGEVLDYR